MTVTDGDESKDRSRELLQQAADHEAERVAHIVSRFVEILDEEQATPGQACGAAAGVWLEAINNVDPEDRHDVFAKVIETIKPPLN